MKRIVAILILGATALASPAKAQGTANVRGAGSNIAAAKAQVQIIRMEQIQFAAPSFAKAAMLVSTGAQTLSRRHLAADGRILIEFT
jgi:hypothetical protein